MIYQVWVPWPEIVDHDQMIYLNETDGRLDLYYTNLEGDTFRVWSTDFKVLSSDVRRYILDSCTVLKMRKQDAISLKAEVGAYEDNFLTYTEGDNDG